MIRILGIDPGLQRAGWGIIEQDGSLLKHIAHGVIATPQKEEMSARLAYLFHGLNDVIQRYNPDEAAVEEVFLNKNPGSTLKLGMARGVCMVVPSQHGLSVAEYGANKIKKAVVGVGHADKTQMEVMVSVLLPGCGAKSDAADALGVAICHSHHRHLNNMDIKNDCKAEGLT